VKHKHLERVIYFMVLNSKKAFVKDEEVLFWKKIQR
jgi:hypothetical protein